MGSINQNVSKSSFFLLREDSSETIGISEVSSFILFVIILLTSKSPFVTGVLSDLIVSFKPFFLKSIDNSPASIKFLF